VVHRLVPGRLAAASEETWGDNLEWYRETEIDAALAASFPTFRQHFVWYAIPELREAWKNEGLRFTSTLANFG